ncbi:hypothetical protein BH23BAC3_BH23BAC3_15000 [soil metagenome]
MNAQELTSMQDVWNAIAAGYDEYVTPTGNWALPNEALRLAGVKRGLRFLDVAAGSGALSIPAARLGAEVVAVDISPVMIEKLTERAQQEDLPNLSAQVMDGHNLELKDNTFDISGSQFGVMLFPDLKRGLRELVRVTKPGGRVFLVTYGPPTEVEFLGIFMKAMKIVNPGFPGMPMDPPPLPFQVAEPKILHQRFEEVGLKNIYIEKRSEILEFYSGEEMWNWVVNSNPIPAMLVSDLTIMQKEEIRQVLDKLLQEKSAGKLPGGFDGRCEHSCGD